MKCSRCGSDRLYQFEKAPSVQVDVKDLPVVCRSCGLITVEGKAVPLPESFGKEAMDMADAAEAAGKEIREHLEEQDPKSLRIERYFKRFYEKAFLDGFFRCLAFYRHESKEGRLRRMREIWDDAAAKEGRKCIYPTGSPLEEATYRGLMMTPEAYTEFEQLLHLSVAPEKPNAQSPSYQSPSVQKRPSQV